MGPWGTAASSSNSNERGAARRRRGRWPTSPPSSAWRSRPCRSGSATSSSSRGRGIAAVTPSHIRSSSRSRPRSSVAAAKAPSASASCPSVSSSIARPRAVRGGGRQDPVTALRFANSDPRMICHLPRVAAALLRDRRIGVCECSCTSTRVSTSMPRSRSGCGADRHPGCAVQQAVPGRRRSDHPSDRSTCSAAPRSCTAAHRTHRRVMGMIEAISSTTRPSGVAQLAEHATVNRDGRGFEPHPRSHARWDPSPTWGPIARFRGGSSVVRAGDS